MREQIDIIRNSGLQIMDGLPADKHFLRFHKPLVDAVVSGERSAIVNVLLRAQLPGDLARRTAEKILAKRRLRG